MSIRHYIGYALLVMLGRSRIHPVPARKQGVSDGSAARATRSGPVGGTDAHPATHKPASAVVSLDSLGQDINAPEIGSAGPRASHEERIVRADCCVVWRAEAWFIPGAYRPGERVICSPTRKGAYLRIQDPNRERPDILAERADPARSRPHNSRAACTEVRWGTPTTSVQAGAGQDVHRARTPGSPPPATEQGSMHPRISGTAPSGRCAAATPMSPGRPIHSCTSRCNLCSCRSLLP